MDVHLDVSLVVISGAGVGGLLANGSAEDDGLFEQEHMHFLHLFPEAPGRHIRAVQRLLHQELPLEYLALGTKDYISLWQSLMVLIKFRIFQTFELSIRRF